MKKCPNCGAQIADDSCFCNKCGKAIPQGVVCPHCGASVNDNDSFCQNCGRNLANVNTTNHNINTMKENSSKKITPIILFVFAFLIGEESMWDCFVNSQVIAAQRFTQHSQS